MTEKRWRVHQPLRLPREACAVVSNKQYIFVIGGQLTDPGPAIDLVEVYSLDWKLVRTSHLIEPRYSATAVVGEAGEVYVLGGISTETTSQGGAVLASPLGKHMPSLVEVCDPAGEEWLPFADMPRGDWGKFYGRCGVGAVIKDGQLWMIGGAEGWKCDSGYEITPGVACLCLASREWTPQHSQLNQARRQLAAVVDSRNAIWAIGGARKGTPESMSLIERLPNGATVWDGTGVNLGSPRFGFAAAINKAKNHLYVLGGIDDTQMQDTLYLNSVEVFDLGTGEKLLSDVPRMNHARYRFGATIDARGILHAVGGGFENTKGLRGTVELRRTVESLELS
jgi:Kelch motif